RAGRGPRDGEFAKALRGRRVGPLELRRLVKVADDEDRRVFAAHGVDIGAQLFHLVAARALRSSDDALGIVQKRRILLWNLVDLMRLIGARGEMNIEQPHMTLIR